MVANGINGWSLEDYDWDEESGVATRTYERQLKGLEPETFIVKYAQPAHEKHIGWKELRRYGGPLQVEIYAD